MNEDNIMLAEFVVKDGKIVHEMYGSEISAETTLISWSMAKSITQALVGIAVLDGLLDVDLPTGLAAWSHDERSAITLRHLLEMRSGLSWIEDYVDGENSDVGIALFENLANTSDRAASADARDQRCNLAVRVPPNLFSRCHTMNGRVRWVGELPHEDGVLAGTDLLSTGDGSAHAFGRRR